MLVTTIIYNKLLFLRTQLIPHISFKDDVRYLEHAVTTAIEHRLSISSLQVVVLYGSVQAAYK